MKNSLAAKTLFFIKREFLLYWRNPTSLINPMLFFLLVIVLIPLGYTTNPDVLQHIGPAVLWLATLFAILLSLHIPLQEELNDGSLQLLVLGTFPLPLLILCKAFILSAIILIPVISFLPIFFAFFHLPFTVFSIICCSLIFGIIILCHIGLLIQSFLLRLQYAHMMLAILVLPLFVPTLIFATSIAAHALTGFEVRGELMLLSALCTLSVTLIPFVASLVIRMVLD